MCKHDGNIEPYDADAAKFSEENSVNLRTVNLNLMSQETIDAAVKHILNTLGRPSSCHCS